MSLIPSTAKFHSSANNGNTVTYALDGHTTKAPRLLIMKRVIPTYTNGVWSKPTYDVKVVMGVLDKDGNPVSPNVQVGTDGIRYPMIGSDTKAVLDQAVAVFGSVVGGTGFSDAVFAQSFPTPA